MVLADGMGGEAGGMLASHGVVKSFLHAFPVSEEPVSIRFEQCLDEASSHLRKLVKDSPSLEGMGTTVIAAHYDGEELTWLSVGDSPMWLFSDGKLVRLNADHSMAQVLNRMVESGELSAEEARNDKGRHMLLSAVTGGHVELVDCGKRSCRLRGQDCILIASDGIQTLSDNDIEQYLTKAEGTAESAADALLSAVYNASGTGQDNVTFILLFGEDSENDSTIQRIDSEVKFGADELSLEARRWNAAPFWKGLGLGLSIGLLATAISLWWLNRSHPPEPVPAHDVTLDVLERSEDDLDGQYLESAERDKPFPLEPRAETPPESR